MSYNVFKKYKFCYEDVYTGAKMSKLSQEERSQLLLKNKSLLQHNIGIIQPFNYKGKLYYAVIFHEKMGVFLFNQNLDNLGSRVQAIKGDQFGS